MTSAIDPRTLPALLKGAIYLPDEGVSSIGGGSRRWASQSQNSGPDYDLSDNGSGEKPVAAFATNGAAIWDMAAGGATANWTVTGPDGGPAFLPRPPGPAVQFTERGSYALWVKADALDSTIHTILSLWPGGASGNRLYFYKNTDEHRLSWFVSRDGSALDDATDPGHRSKGSTGSAPGAGVLVDWTEWHFVRITWFGAGENYALGGGNFSDKVEVRVDEVLIAGGAANDGPSGAGSYSAPVLGASPPDGPVRVIATGAGKFSLGSDGGLSQWNGQIGPGYVENADVATPLTPEEWVGVMRFRAPVDFWDPPVIVPGMALDGAPVTRGYRFDQLLDGRGTALATDATAPSSSHLPPERFVATLPQGRPLTGGGAFVFHALDGTSITVSLWVFEESTSAWLLFKSAVVVATASDPVVASVAGFAVPPGARVFVQVTANTGVTALGWRWC